jgi:hypothetical protein
MFDTESDEIEDQILQLSDVKIIAYQSQIGRIGHQWRE